MSIAKRVSIGRAQAPSGRFKVITAAEAGRRFGLYPEQIYAGVEAGWVHDVGDQPRDPRKSAKGHTKYPEWELERWAERLRSGVPMDVTLDLPIEIKKPWKQFVLRAA